MCRLVGSAFSHPPSERGHIISQILQMRTLSLREGAGNFPSSQGYEMAALQLEPRSVQSPCFLPLGLPFAWRADVCRIRIKSPPLQGCLPGSPRSDLADRDCLMNPISFSSCKLLLGRPDSSVRPWDKPHQTSLSWSPLAQCQPPMPGA